MGSHLRGWLRCSCGFSWRASLLASALVRGRSSRDSAQSGPAAATPGQPAESPPTLPGLPSWVKGHDPQELADDLQTWLAGGKEEFPQRRLAQNQSELLAAILDNPAIAAQPIVDNCPPDGAARATRYRVALPLQYRSKGAPEWHSGFTGNLSRSEILFRLSEDPLILAEENSEHRMLELSLKLRRIGSDTASGPIRCHGAVVRLEAPGALRTQPAVAVAFDA